MADFGLTLNFRATPTHAKFCTNTKILMTHGKRLYTHTTHKAHVNFEHVIHVPTNPRTNVAHEYAQSTEFSRLEKTYVKNKKDFVFCDRIKFVLQKTLKKTNIF